VCLFQPGFFTFAYDDTRSTFIIRLSQPSQDNTHFPADPTALLEALLHNEPHLTMRKPVTEQDKSTMAWNQSNVEIKIPLNTDQFHLWVTHSPVHAADVFRKLLVAVFHALFQIDISSGVYLEGEGASRKTKALAERDKGCFGRTRAAAGAVEVCGWGVGGSM